MAEPGSSILRGDGFECFANKGLVQRLCGARFGARISCLSFGPGFFDGI